uniref:Putative secreted protein n=1 Tax=Anopheles triannulatus TaxID=58253 RepID=A0A2M4B4K7_9DIPT
MVIYFFSNLKSLCLFFSRSLVALTLAVAPGGMAPDDSRTSASVLTPSSTLAKGKGECWSKGNGLKNGSGMERYYAAAAAAAASGLELMNEWPTERERDTGSMNGHGHAPRTVRVCVCTCVC